MVTINKDWLIETNNLADEFEAGEIGIDKFTDDQLHYLIYWNWGYSGTSVANETKDSEAELIRRGNPYNPDYAVELSAEEFY